jgi:hypothetical protein
MSLQNEVGRIFLDVKDVAISRLTQDVVTKNRENNWNLSDDQLKELTGVIRSSLVQSFDRGVDTLISAITSKK